MDQAVRADQATAVGAPPSKPWRVLVVDDHAPLRALVHTIFKRDARFDVVGDAADGVEGVTLAKSLRPDVVLLDLSMPRMDGLEALVAIRNALPDTRVVILSGFDESRLATLVGKLGASGYLEKGASPDEMVSAVATYALAPLPPIPQERPDAIIERARELI